MRGYVWAFAAGLLAVAAAGQACAADEEIQVYIDDIGPPHKPGLDVHLNYVPEGRDFQDYPDEQLSQHRTRITPEWSYALDPNLELGLYLPLATISGDGRFQAAGAKARIKWIAPKAQGQDWFWGANFEIGRVAHSIDINPWNAELKGILGVRKGRWLLAGNLNLDWAVSGPDKGPATFQLATMALYSLDEKTQVGVENYNGLGGGPQFFHLGRQDQEAYLVVQREIGKWDVNFGVGRGYGTPEDTWVLKAIVGVPIS